MSMMEVDNTESSNPNEIIHLTTNKNISNPHNRKRSVQYPNEYDSQNYTPKRNRMKTSNDHVDDNHRSPSSGHDKRKDEGAPPPSTTTTTSYFNTRQQFKQRKNESSAQIRHESPQQTFPPFRITLQDDTHFPSTELGIIKEINKHCRLNLTYGRFTKTSDDQMCFLLYASTTTQFEHLMSESNWPPTINNTNYKLDLPNKIPTSYSIVIQNVPSQWNTHNFGNELKQVYPSIVRVARLFINGGRPLSKVRVDFSSHKELSTILKAKRILLDDANIAFPVEPYLPPTRILRCYNCQVYDDHIAAHCPNKNKPVCFRCAQNHPYNPNCKNAIKCAHCQVNHMAGNPSCPIKSEKRQEKNQRRKAAEVSAPTTRLQHNRAWSGDTLKNLFEMENESNIVTTTDISKNNKTNQIDILNMFEKLNTTMLQIKQQQNELNEKLDIINVTLNCHHKDINQIKYCIYEIICPLVKEISNQIQSKAKGTDKQVISPIHNKLIEFISNFINPTNENPGNLANGISDKPKAKDRATTNNDYITNNNT